MKNSFRIVYLILLTLGVIACEKDLYNLEAYQNHKVFKVYANISPQQNNVAITDTIWISVDASGLTFNDQITEKAFQLDTATFISQIRLYDRVDFENVVPVNLILKSGEIHVEQIERVKDNTYSFIFSGNHAYLLRIGLLFDQPGSYAIGFNNFPNPYLSCNGPDCDKGQGIWFDVYHSWDEQQKTFLKQDFADYVFSINNPDYLAPALDAGNSDDKVILDNCIYPEAVFFVKIK